MRFCLVLVVSLVVPASALGATRYASPTGGETAPCAVTAPCSLKYAITAAAGGDEVKVTAGTYQVAELIKATVPLTIRGVVGAVKPKIVAPAKKPALALFGASTISDLAFEGAESGEGVLSDGEGGFLERLEIKSVGHGAGLVVSNNWTLTDSLFVVEGKEGFGLFNIGITEGVGTMRNDTVVATGEEALGIALLNLGGMKPMELNVVNTIVSAPKAAFAAGNTKTVLSFDHSDVQGTTGSDGTGGALNSTNAVTAPPAFVNAAAGDFREAAGSPTIDAGVNDPANGATDLLGSTRSLPARLTCTAGVPPAITDIGAYELVPVAPPCAPVVVPPPAPGTYLQKATISGSTATFRFDAVTSAASGFECKLDAKPWHTCTSPRTYKHLKPGRHTFRVRAFGAGGVDLTPVVRKFKVRAPRHHHRHHHA
jgi:hypothetical protein